MTLRVGPSRRLQRSSDSLKEKAIHNALAGPDRVSHTNKMEPTYSKTNTQTMFDTLVGDTFVGHSCRTHSFRKALWDTLAHSCRTPCMTLTLVGHSCRTLL